MQKKILCVRVGGEREHASHAACAYTLCWLVTYIYQSCPFFIVSSNCQRGVEMEIKIERYHDKIVYNTIYNQFVTSKIAQKFFVSY